MKNEKNSMTKFDALLLKRLTLVMGQAPIENIMSATAEIARFELEEFSKGPIKYELKSLQIVDSMIDNHRNLLQETQGAEDTFSIWFGAFLGLVMINEIGGNWQPISKEDWIFKYRDPTFKFENNMFTSPTTIISKSIWDNQYKIADYTNQVDALSKLSIFQIFPGSTKANN